MMVHVADAVEKGLKSVKFPSVSSNCCGHSRCVGTFGVLWDRKDPNRDFGLPHNIDLSSAAPERKLPRRPRRTFQMSD